MAPILEAPILLAAWPGMGLVALKTVDYLIHHLPTTLVKEVEADELPSLHGVTIDQGLVQPVELPKGRLYAHAAGPGGQDLLLYLGDEQPVSGKEWAAANAVLDEALGMGIKRVYTFAAMPTEIDHRAEPTVWATATEQYLLEELARHDVRIMSEGTITGLNGILLGVACLRGIAGCCLLGEIPKYLTQTENPRSTLAIIEQLESIIIGLSVDLSELRILAQATSAQIEHYLDQVRGEKEQSGDMN